MAGTTLAGDPILGSVAAVNFFNGRILRGEDLSREQAGHRIAHERLGRAIGSGVAAGLEVTVAATPGPAAIRIAAGLALGESGLALALEGAVTVALVDDPETVAPAGDGRFSACLPPRPPGSAGIPLLLVTIAPAPAQPRGRARVATLGNEPAACAVDVLVEAVRIRLVPFAIPEEAVPTGRVRGRAASLLLGSDAPLLAGDPLGPRPETLLDRLRRECLGPDEVPLAVLSWPEADRIAFCDRWAARRRVRDPSGCEDDDILAEARSAQFQEHAADLIDAGAARNARAGQHFAHLPPAGILPLARTGAPGAGFDDAAFFTGLAVHRHAFVEGAKLPALLRAARAYPPIPVDRRPAEAVWRYAVRSDATPKLPGDRLEPPYLLFITGHVPYAADAQWDLGHWDQANYAL